ncbi:ABC transporter permease [Aquiflexum gelatinilyticum]|uniref:ABC transporter permease n=1 Tax=Aquiflexum gelatinilyticum TaxID=2961943 RepID=UPI002167B66C|nr:ABC transporter permease [Aquiflexum gelatinilyticum]MCS4436652.1 ABC transporter permease [Aquiflexum gelatinilyticum]
MFGISFENIGINLTVIPMFSNYLIISFRNFYKFRFYTLINVLGLTIGITACLVIFLYVRFELSYDKYHKNADSIMRVDWDLQMGEEQNYQASVTPPVAQTLVAEYPEVEAAARFRYLGSFQFKREIENFIERRVIYADNDIFRIFSIPFVSGNPETALIEPFSMVISESFAEQLFPNEDALGKTLIKDNKTLYQITGIFKDLPDNSHFHYKVFLSMEGLDESKNGNWIGGPFNTYVLLHPDADPIALEKKLPDLVENYILPYAQVVLGNAFMDDFQSSAANHLTLRLMPLTKIHLHSNLRNELEGNGDINYVYAFSIIAVIILLIACINFINLATARSSGRAREVGIRKVMGSTRTNLALQFIGESTILCIFSFFLALLLTQLVLPYFNSMTGMNLQIPMQDYSLLIFVAISALIVGIVSGIYPGIVLSSFQPVQVLKGKVTGNKQSFTRSSLVIFQFAISIFLIITTVAVHQQVQYMKSRKMGFNPEQVLMLKWAGNLGDNLTVLKNKMMEKDLITAATVSSYFPGPGYARSTPLIWKYGSTPNPETSATTEKWMVDHDYVTTMGIELVSGRNFSLDFPSDSSAVILNESAISKLALEGDPIGQKISLFQQDPDGTQQADKLETWEIIGIAKDFNFESLRQTVSPLGLFFGKSQNVLALRYNAEETQRVIEELEKNWKELAPGEPFVYSFLDQDFQNMFNTETRVGKLLTVFSALAIIIASLGLFALTAYTVEQRVKEIGIRKVMGASIQNIILLLTKDFGKLVLWAFLFAAPLAAIGIRWFLQSYAYKTTISLWIYIGAGLATFALALIIMGYQSITAASANPVKSLRSE